MQYFYTKVYLSSLSSDDIHLLTNYYNISSTNRNDLLWLLAITVLSKTHIHVDMPPYKYDPSLLKIFSTDPLSEYRTNGMIIGFVGDVMLGRSVNDFINKDKSFVYPWGDILPIMQKNNLNIINLETTLTTSTNKVPKVFNFKATPDKVEILKNGHISVVNLANNHILDFGSNGLTETLETLKKAKISFVGAGRNIIEASRPLIIERNGIHVGILGYTDNEPGWKAAENKPGTNYIKVGNTWKVINDIKHLRTQVDLVVVSLHWGPNMRENPSKKFIDFAHQMINAGVDIIHGHSAHIIQGIEIYKSKLILYDTGDFIDDYAIDPLLRNDQSLLYRIFIAKDGLKQVQLLPVIISNYQVNLAKGQEYKMIMHRIQKLSLIFGTKISENGSILIK
jgi:poly-gamma-glutamate synthesis protein (capsule biosynthesis protein)